MNIWKFLHVAFMFGAVTFAVGGRILERIAAQSNDMGAVRVMLAWRRLEAMVGMPLFISGILLGFVTAVTSGISLTAPWLIIAYILVAFGALTGVLLDDPVFRKIKTAAQPTSGDVPPEVNSGLNSTRVRAFQWIAYLVFAAAIFTMVAKPFA